MLEKSSLGIGPVSMICLSHRVFVIWQKLNIWSQDSKLMAVPGGSAVDPAANPREFGSCRIRPAPKIDTYPDHAIHREQPEFHPRLFTRLPSLVPVPRT